MMFFPFQRIAQAGFRKGFRTIERSQTIHMGVEKKKEKKGKKNTIYRYT